MRRIVSQKTTSKLSRVITSLLIVLYSFSPTAGMLFASQQAFAAGEPLLLNAYNPLTPGISTPSKTADGFVAQVYNYDAAFSWAVSSTAGSATINGSGLVTVTGLPPETSSTVTIVTSRANYPNGTSTVAGISLQAEMETTNLTTCDELLRIDDYDASMNKDYTLANDLDCSAISNFTPIGNDPDGSNHYFEGTFDGQGHTIRGLHVDQFPNYIGLFSQIHKATIRNLHLRDGSITAESGSDVGSFAGFAYNSSFDNVSSNLTITGYMSWAVGGIAGYIEAETDSDPTTPAAWSITNSSFTGHVTGSNSTGGIVGALDMYEGFSYTIRKTYSDAIVSSGNIAGGIAGRVNIGGTGSDHDDSKGLFVDTYSRSSVHSAYAGAGGIIGFACSSTNSSGNKTTLEVDSSYSSGDVFAADYGAGGIIGMIDCYNNSPQNTYKITNSFVAGRVETDSVNLAYGIIGGTDWHEGDDTFDISNNVVDDSNAQVNGLGTYYDNDPTKIVRTASTDPNYFFGNQSNAPLNTWDFDAVWGAHETEYPTFLHGAVAVNLLSAEDGSKVRISQAGCDAINTSSTIKESSLSVQDPGYTYPVGFSSFSLTGCGASAQITATFTGAFDVNKIVIRKYNSISGVFSTLNTANSGLVLTSTTLDGKPALKVSYTIADGGLLDQDGLVDGNIADPIGVGSAFGVPNTGFGSGLSLIKSKANI